MHSMKRIQLAVVFLIAAAFLAGEPARAAGASDMTCVVGASDEDFGASGAVKFWDYDWWVCGPDYATSYSATMQVACKDLTPGAAYEIWCHTNLYGTYGWYPVSFAWDSFTADKRGCGSAKGDLFWGESGVLVEVRRIDPTTVDGYTVVLVWQQW